MDEEFKRSFGYCIVPKDTILFRGYEITSHRHCMFFAMSPFAASAFNKKIQIWKTIKEIEIAFMVSHLDDRSWTYSNISEIYSKLFPSDIFLTDLAIKHHDVNRRDKFIEELNKRHKVLGWLSSLEGKIELEVCLFDLDNYNRDIIKFVAFYKDENLPFKNSLRRIKIFPPERFFSKTAIKLAENAPIGVGNNHYKRYLSNRKYLYEDATKDDIAYQKEENFNLRLKLKI